MMLRYITITSLLSVTLNLYTQASPSDFNSLAAVVNGNVITRSEVQEAIKHTEQMIMLTVSEEDKRKKQLATLKEDALNSLIERELILTEFKKIGGKIREELITQDVNKIINSERFGGDRDKFLKELVKTGMTLKRFKDLREKILTVELMRSRESRNVLVVTPKQIEEAYQKYSDQFRQESFVQLRTLMIPKVSEDTTVTKEQQLKHIKEIRKQIVKGETFEQMAKTYSKDSVADKGGDRGTIGEDSIELRRDLKTAAFQLESGQLSDVIEGPFAFYLLKVDSKKIGKKKPLANKEVRATCEKLALLDLRKEVHDRWISRLKKNASIRRFDNQGRLITATPPAEPTTEPVSAPALPYQQPIGSGQKPLPVASVTLQQEKRKIFPRILRRTQNLLKRN